MALPYRFDHMTKVAITNKNNTMNPMKITVPLGLGFTMLSFSSH
jgi:hypothetical protein